MRIPQLGNVMLVPDLQELSCPSCELSCLARLRVQAGCSLTAASHAAYADEHYIASHWIEQHSWLHSGLSLPCWLCTDDWWLINVLDMQSGRCQGWRAYRSTT